MHAKAGVNERGFNFKLAMVKMCSKLTPFKNMPFKKKMKWAYGKGKKLTILILFLPLVKMYSNQT